MTAREVLEFRHSKDDLQKIDVKELQKVIDDALGKQIPKEVKYYGDYEDCTAECPNTECETNLTDEVGSGIDYCPYCGQRLVFGLK